MLIFPPLLKLKLYSVEKILYFLIGLKRTRLICYITIGKYLHNIIRITLHFSFIEGFYEQIFQRTFDYDDI